MLRKAGWRLKAVVKPNGSTYQEQAQKARFANSRRTRYDE